MRSTLSFFEFIRIYLTNIACLLLKQCIKLMKQNINLRYIFFKSCKRQHLQGIINYQFNLYVNTSLYKMRRLKHNFIVIIK